MLESNDIKTLFFNGLLSSTLYKGIIIAILNLCANITIHSDGLIKMLNDQDMTYPMSLKNREMLSLLCDIFLLHNVFDEIKLLRILIHISN